MTGKLLLVPALQNRAFNNVERAFWALANEGIAKAFRKSADSSGTRLAAAGFIAAMSVRGDGH
jgi:hypothetical protein